MIIPKSRLAVPINSVKRTGGILAAADLNELLDIGDFGRHDDGCGCFEARCKGEGLTVDARASEVNVRITLGLLAAKALA